MGCTLCSHMLEGASVQHCVAGHATISCKMLSRSITVYHVSAWKIPSESIWSSVSCVVLFSCAGFWKGAESIVSTFLAQYKEKMIQKAPLWTMTMVIHGLSSIFVILCLCFFHFLFVNQRTRDISPQSLTLYPCTSKPSQVPALLASSIFSM